jgi:hypothetical protein
LERMMKNAENLNRNFGIRVNISFLECPNENGATVLNRSVLFYRHHKGYFEKEKNNMRSVNVIVNE